MAAPARVFKTNATERKHRITVIRTTRTNDRGVVKAVNDEIGTYWASVKNLTEASRIMYQTSNVRATHVVSMDGRVDVQEADKLKLGARIFEILTIKQVDETDKEKVIITEEIRPK